MRRTLIILFALSFIVTACSNLSGTQQISEPPGTPAETASGSPASDFPTPDSDEMVSTPATGEVETPFPTEPQAAPIRYTLSVDFHFGYRRLSVIETIDYTNQTGETLPVISLTVEPNRQPDVFQLASVIWDDGSQVEYSLDNRLMDVTLPAPLEPGQAVRFSIAYELFPPVILDADDENDRPYAFGYTDKQINLVDWYPMVAPYKAGSGWLIHNPWYYGEHVVYEKSDFDVTIHLQEPPDSLVIAASAEAEEVEGGYHYILKNARSFAWSASPDYQVRTQTVGDVTISSYYFPFDSEAGEQALSDTATAFELYNRLYGEYPHSFLSVVEADFLDGMEYEGLYFLSRGFYNLYNGTPQGYLTAIAVHETAHQWWYGAVSNDQALEPWLDESFCTYSEYLFYESTYPEMVDWWWAFRVDFYNPAGFIDGRLYDFYGYRPYLNAVYLNGAHFFHDLREQMGDDNFFAFIKDYAQKNNGDIVTRSDFFTLLDEYTDQDLTALIVEYFKNP